MSLKQTIENEYKNALKSKDKNKISTYRLILSSIKDLDIVNRSGPNKKETDDEDIKKLLKKMVKQRAESIDIYKKNNRTDLLEIEQNEYDILSSFLPKQLSEEETKKICSDIISKIGANSLPLFFKETVFDTTVETFSLFLISSRYSFGYFIIYLTIL